MKPILFNFGYDGAGDLMIDLISPELPKEARESTRITASERLLRVMKDEIAKEDYDPKDSQRSASIVAVVNHISEYLLKIEREREVEEAEEKDLIKSRNK